MKEEYYEMLGIVDNEDNIHKIFVPFNNGESIEGFDRIFHHAGAAVFLILTNGICNVANGVKQTSFGIAPTISTQKQV